MKLADFDYPFDKALIAQYPTPKRESAGLLVYHRATGEIEHRTFGDILDYLKPSDLLILNDTRVFLARLWGRKMSTGTSVECLLLRELEQGCWEGMIRGAVRVGESLDFGAGWIGSVVGGDGNGRRWIRFRGGKWVSELLEREGSIPLPPYIRRRPQAEDFERYQTVYASRIGSVAAPTAGLHFSHELLERIRARRVRVVTVTLHIGPGTFQPIRNEFVEDHRMEEEEFQVSRDVIENLVKTRKEGGRVVAIGTSSTRVIESLPEGCPVQDRKGRTDLFIFPGYRFRWLNAFVTNFHLPKSTPYLLTSAFTGCGALRSVYAEAMRRGYRFYSYGDAMMIL